MSNPTSPRKVLASITEAHDREGLLARIAVLEERVRELETERDQAEAVTDERTAALRESEARYRVLTDLSPDAILVHQEGRYVYANQAAARLLRARDPSELIGRSPFEVAEPEYHDFLRERIRGILEHKGTNPLAYMCWRRFDGTVVDAESAGAAITWQGRPAIQVVVRDITERKQAEAALHATETWLDLAFEVADLGTWELDLRSRGSPRRSFRHDQIFGYREPVADWSYERFFQHIHPEDREGVDRRFRAALERRIAWDFECRIFRIGGELRWISARGGMLHDADGQPVRALGTVEDITDRKQAEEALRRSERKYRTLFESIDEGFCVIEVLFDASNRPVDYRFLETNPAFVKQTGLEDTVCRTARELLPSLEEHWFEAYGKVAQTGEPMRFVSRSDAMHRWFDVFAFPVEEPEDRKVAILFTNITEQKRAAEERERLLGETEKARAEAEAAEGRLGRVFQHSPAYIATVRGPDHVFEMANPFYRQLAGNRELVDKPAREAVPELIEQGYIDLLDQVYETGEPYVATEARVIFQGSPGAPLNEHFINFVYQPLPDASEAVSGILAHGVDVTEQVRARREIEAARAEAEAANRAKSEFLAVMSHELRTPLNAIGGYAELIDMGIRGPVTEAQRADLARIQASQRHLLGLINEVLNYAKLETGSVHYEITAIPVHDILADAEALVAPQVRVKGLTLQIGECPPDLAVHADAEKFRQILVNLLSNALKFTDSGAIELRCEVENRQLAVHVRDTGIGIPPEKLEVVFEPFVQVRADLTRTAEGTGLGLAISRDLARGMGGDLTVESTPGEGSTFTLRLPRVEDEQEGSP